MNTIPGSHAKRPEDLSLRPLFPNLNDHDLQQVEDLFYGYLELVWDIYEKAIHDHPEHFDKPQRPS